MTEQRAISPADHVRAGQHMEAAWHHRTDPVAREHANAAKRLLQIDSSPADMPGVPGGAMRVKPVTVFTPNY